MSFRRSWEGLVLVRDVQANGEAPGTTVHKQTRSLLGVFKLQETVREVSESVSSLPHKGRDAIRSVQVQKR
jgi:hypothetical protein